MCVHVLAVAFITNVVDLNVAQYCHWFRTVVCLKQKIEIFFYFFYLFINYNTITNYIIVPSGDRTPPPSR